ncbi:MAG: hypothetical protein U1F43_16275 [Myxococcota bacterium]
MPPPTTVPRPRPDLELARRFVLVRRPLHWELAARLIAALDAAWAELDARPAPAADEVPPERRRAADAAQGPAAR